MIPLKHRLSFWKKRTATALSIEKELKYHLPKSFVVLCRENIDFLAWEVRAQDNGRECVIMIDLCEPQMCLELYAKCIVQSIDYGERGE